MPFEIWIFRNGQPDRNDNRLIFVAMTSTQEQRILVWVAFVSAADNGPDHCTAWTQAQNIATDEWNVGLSEKMNSVRLLYSFLFLLLHYKKRLIAWIYFIQRHFWKKNPPLSFNIEHIDHFQRLFIRIYDLKHNNLDKHRKDRADQ